MQAQEASHGVDPLLGRLGPTVDNRVQGGLSDSDAACERKRWLVFRSTMSPARYGPNPESMPTVALGGSMR